MIRFLLPLFLTLSLLALGGQAVAGDEKGTVASDCPHPITRC